VSDSAWCFVVLGVVVALFVWNRFSVGLVAVFAALALYATGVVDATTAVAGFGDPIVVFIAGLFVVAEGLEATGVTAWAGQQLLARVGTGRSGLLVALVVLAAVMAALVTPNGSAAALLPIMVVAARRSGTASSQLAMPLAFGASVGALLALSGSPVNVVVSQSLKEQTGSGFGYFEFALVGLPLLAVTILVAWRLGPRLLPHRTPSDLPADYSAHPATVAEHYELDQGFYRLRVPGGSSALGRRAEDLVDVDDARVVGVQDATGVGHGPDRELADGDTVVVSGASSSVTGLTDASGLRVVSTPLTRATPSRLVSRDRGVAEVVVPPRSPLVGSRRFPGFTRNGVTVLGIRRLGHDTGLDGVDLQEGDAMLVHGAWPDVEALARSEELLVVDSPELVRRQLVPLGARAWRALAVLAATVALLATGVAPPAIAGLVGAAGMVLLRVVTPQQAYRAVSWETVVLVGGLIPLSVAIQASGAADSIANAIVGVVPAGNSHVLLIALFVLTAVLGQVVSNTATVLIVTPIAVSAAAETGTALAPVLMLVAVAGAASFLTPIATPANMMVMGPGGYRFGDYWRLGIVTMLAWLVVCVVLIPVVWPLAP
jgi:di/tricarboxylate transporter